MLELYVSTYIYTSFTQANTLIVVAIRGFVRNRSGGRLDRRDDVLGPLSQEDRVRKVTSFFDIYAVDIADVHAQN